MWVSARVFEKPQAASLLLPIMKIDTLGEFNLIERLSGHFPWRTDTVGIGDDCSATVLDKNFFQIVTTDLLIEDVHFLRGRISPFDLARKAIAVNASDIAAMGGIAEAAHLSVGFPNGIDISYFDEFCRGLKSGCDNYRIELLGGDTTRSPEKIVINVSIQGRVERDGIKLRSEAKPEDVICLTDTVGDSGIGLGILTNKWTTPEDGYFIDKHNVPSAPIEEGRWLSRFGGVHAMIDVSDGVVSDVGHVCGRSRTRARIDIDSLPLSKRAEDFFSTQNHGRLGAAGSGEDYCLLAAIDPRSFSDISTQFQRKFGRPLFAIGRMEKGEGVHITYGGKTLERPLPGYDHFGKRLQT